jgi:hypothetical protein
MVDLKKKYKKVFDAKFTGATIETNIVNTSSDIQSINPNYFKVRK